MDSFSDRFEPSNYEEEETVSVGLVSIGQEIEWVTSLPEPLFVRAQAIASGYDLHLLPNIDRYEETRLNQTQCETLVEELEFILTVINDKLLASIIRPFIETLLRVARSPEGLEVVIEGP